MKAYEIIIADDHAMVRHGIRRIIEENKRLKVVGEAADGLGLMNILKRIQPDLVILDISMPYLRGLEAAREIKSLYRDIKVLILTMHKNQWYMQQTLATGCDGYLLKEDAGDQLVKAIERIRDNGIFVSSLLSEQAPSIDSRPIQPSLRGPHCDRLTLRERQVLKLIAEGKSNREIAHLLHVSVRTIEHHRLHMHRKLRIKSMMDLLNYAISKGYITVEQKESHHQFMHSQGDQSPNCTHSVDWQEIGSL